MAAKKDFSKTNTGRVYSAIQEATAPIDDYDAQRLEELEKATQPDDYAAQRYQEQEKRHPELFKQEVQEESDGDEKPQRKPRRTYTPEEIKEAKKHRKTQGKKGMKLTRINMAFDPELYDYIRVMARVYGGTITDFVNVIVKRSYEADRETYEKAKQFIKTLDGQLEELR